MTCGPTSTVRVVPTAKGWGLVQVTLVIGSHWVQASPSSSAAQTAEGGKVGRSGLDRPARGGVQGEQAAGEHFPGPGGQEVKSVDGLGRSEEQASGKTQQDHHPGEEEAATGKAGQRMIRRWRRGTNWIAC